MNLERIKKRLPVFWILHVSGWLAYTGASAFFTYQEDWTDIPQLLLFALPYVAGFAICIPLRFFYKRIHFHEQPLKYSIPIAVSASFIGSNIWMGTAVGISHLLNLLPAIPLTFFQLYFVNVLSGGIILLGWTFLYFGIKTRIEWKEQEKRKEKAYSLAQDAQLQMLRYQLNPHFLFNSMNSIRALIDEDEMKAREMITELSEFLRYSLDSKDYSNVPLKNEIEAIRHYLAIQKKRYEDKLEIFYEIEPQSGEFPVLSFLIHPLVENAIKYGMQTSSMPLSVQLKTKISKGGLLIEIENTGKWVEQAGDKDQMRDGTGTGLDNVRARLQNAFPNRHSLEFFEKEGSVHVQLEIRGLTEKSGEKKI